MRPKASLHLSGAAIGAALLLTLSPAQLPAQQTTPAGVTVGESDLGGVVSGPNGPEAGVWVIAETTDLPTKFAKMVVTDDQGRYVLPELPKANYTVWVRGYGLVDSPKLQSTPGKILNLNAVTAPNAAAAAEYYPAIYWYSMLKVPDKSEFPGTGPQGNGMSTNMKSQAQWLDVVKTNGCYTCHQLGNKATRTIPIIMASSQDPTALGLAASLARPGGNVTGFWAEGDEALIGKQLDLLKHAVPGIARVGVMVNPDDAADPRGIFPYSPESTLIAHGIILDVQCIRVDNPND